MLFDFLNLHGSLEEQANEFLNKARQNIQWSQDSMMKFLDFHRKDLDVNDIVTYCKQTAKQRYTHKKHYCALTNVCNNCASSFGIVIIASCPVFNS